MAIGELAQPSVGLTRDVKQTEYEKTNDFIVLGCCYFYFFFVLLHLLADVVLSFHSAVQYHIQTVLVYLNFDMKMRETVPGENRDPNRKLTVSKTNDIQTFLVFYKCIFGLCDRLARLDYCL